MYRIIVSILLFMGSQLGFAQINGFMYWEMRQRFLDKYIRVGEGHGMSIPASWVVNRNGLEDYGNGLEETKDILEFQDESLRHIGWYIAVLATENKLLKNHSQPTVENEQEIYYALKAINRLDGYGEYLYNVQLPNIMVWDEATKSFTNSNNTSAYTDFSGTELNGFMVREDVPPNFHLLFPIENYLVYHQGNDGWIKNNLIQAPKPNGRSRTVISQDQFYHIMFGLSFLKKFVPSTLTYNGMNFHQEAKAICSRVMRAFDGNYHLINPVDGEMVQGLSGEEIGNAALYSWLVAVMADWFVRDVDYSPFQPAQIVQDIVNPDFNITCTNSKALWSGITGATQVIYLGNSFESANAIMMQLLLCMSNAFAGLFPPTPAYLNLPEWMYKNPGYRFYGTAYRLLHDYPFDIGYSKLEMEEMLGAMDCEGPRWYSKKEFVSFPPVEYESDYDIIRYLYLDQNPLAPGQITTPVKNTTKNDPFEGYYIGMDITWLSEENPVWNRDNIFVQAPFHTHGDHWQNGHYNGIDFMLLHNVYQLLIFEQADGFETSMPGEFIEHIGANTFCGSNCTLHGILPYVSQDSETKTYLDPNPPFPDLDTYIQFGAVRQVGTGVLPYVRTSTGDITLNLKLQSVTIPVFQTHKNENENPPVTYSATHVEFFPKAIFKATGEINHGVD